MNKYLQPLLIFSLALSIIASVLKLFNLPGANILLIYGLLSLAIVCVLQGFFDKTFRGISRGMVIALACTGVLFKLMHLPHGDLVFKIAIATGIAWFAYTSFISKGDKA